MANKIGIVLALDGEKEFTTAVQTAKKEVNLFQSELKGLSEEFDGQANSMEALTRKQKVLTQQQEAYQRKLDAAKSGQEKANKNYQDMGKRLTELKSDLENARKELQKMDEGTEEYKKQAKAVEDLEKAVEKQTIAHTREAGSIAEWNQRVRESQRELDKSNDEIEKNARYLDEARSSADHCATSIDKMGREIKEAAKDVDKIGDEAKDTAKNLSEAGKTASVFGGVLAGNLASNAIEKSLELAGQAVDAVKESMYDLSGASADLAAKTGLSEEAMQRYREVMTEIKGDNFGESYGDVADVMAEIVQIMGEMDPSAMKDATESAITLRDTFDMDVNESIRAVDVMMKTMGVDSKTAFDLIAKGAQNGLDRSHELTDNITEYGQLWGQMGFSAQEMFSILENGLDSGAYNLDKVNDYVKEFGVSLADGRIEKNIGKFSDGTKELFGQWKNGEASARDVFYSVINDLSEMTDQQEALTIASDTWSALGEDNAMQVITALDDVNTAYNSVQGTMDKLKETKYSDLESAVSQLGASVQENVLTPIAEKALPLITGGVKLATGAIEGVGKVLNPAKEELSAFSQYVQDTSTEIQETNEATKKAVEEAKGSFDAAVMDSDGIGVLGDRLMELNSVEQLTTTQKAEMQAIVAKLSESIPELSGAYDDENGKLNKTNEELAALVKNYQNAAIAQAATAATQELVNAQMEATVNKVKAESLRDMLENEKSVWGSVSEVYQQMADREFGLAEAQAEAREIWKKALDDGKVSLDQYNEAVNQIDTSNAEQLMGSLDDKVGKLTDGIEEQNLAIKDSEKTIKDCGNEIEVVNKAQEKMASEAEVATSKINGLSEAMGKGMPTDVAEKMAGALSDVSDAYDETAEAAEDAAEASEDAAEKVKTGAETQKEAIQGVLDTYHGYVDEIENDLQNKVSLFDKFDGGTDMTAEEMETNMQSYVDGIRKYQENLAYVKEQMGEDLSPEFLQYIEDMGLDAANLLEHYAVTIRNQGEEGKKIIKDTNDDYMEYLDLTGPIAEAQAANKTAMDAYTGALGSSEIDFTNLKDSIETAKMEAAGAWDGLSEATESALDDAVQTAQTCGVKIPEGLAEGINSGDISPEQAVEQLSGALQGSLEGLAGVAKDAGLKIPDEITAGIQSGDPSQMQAAYNQLISYITENADTDALKQVFDEASSEAATAIGDKSDEAKAGGETLAQAGAAGADSKATEFQAAGDEAAGKYVEAIRAHIAEAAQAAGALASAAQNAIMSYRNAFENAGYYMSTGIAQGIRDGASSAINAARSMAAQTLAAAKAELDIHSPSKKFRQQVGQNISESTAFGIKDKASLAGKESAKMSALVYDKATAWLSKYKKSHKLSLDDEKYYWEQVVQHVKKGTAAYNNAIKKLATATFSGTGLSGSAATAALKKIESNFGVSRTKTTGSGKNQKTVNKDAEAYYSEIYSAANKYLSNMQTLNDWSLQAELEYWEAVQAQLKKGTQAWYDAQAQINSAKSGIANEAREAAEALEEANNQIVSDAEDYVRKQKILNQMSAQQELAYWQGIAGAVREGSDAWYDALEHVNDLTEQVQQEMEDAAEAAREAAEAQQEAYEDALEAIKAEKEAAQERIRTTASVQNAILSKYKTYYSLSAKAEMEYWDIARKQFQKGTDERIEADQAYFDAREEYYDQLAELDEDYAEKKQDIDDDLTKSIKDLQGAYDDAVNSRKREILSSFNLFEGWDAEGYNKDKLLENLRTQVEGVEFWADQLEELGQKGVTEELMQELRDMGPDAAANLWSLNQMTSEQLDEYQKLWEEKNRIAQEQARLDNESLWQETQDSIAEARQKAQEELEAAKSEYDKAVADLNDGLADGLKDLVTQAGDIGEDMVSALVEAVRAGVKSVSDEIAKLKREAEEAQRLAEEAAAEKVAADNKAAAEKATAQQAEEARQAAEQQEAARQAAAQQAAEQQRQAQIAAEQERQAQIAAEQAEKAANEKAAQEAAAQYEKKKLQDVIKSGTKRSKTITKEEKKEHVELWEYIVKNYGYAPNNNVYKNLAAILGISTGATVSNAKKNKILEELKKRGLATGARNIWQDELAWILENQKTEYVVRTADNAILQPMRAGDKVINPKGAENLYDFAADPTKFISTRARDALAAAQEAMQKRQDEMRSQIPELSYGGITRLNRLMESGMQAAPVVNVDNKDLVSMMQQMVSGMQAIMGQMQELQERQIVMDSGALVGALQQPMSRASAAVQRRRNRGTLR